VVLYLLNAPFLDSFRFLSHLFTATGSSPVLVYSAARRFVHLDKVRTENLLPTPFNLVVDPLVALIRVGPALNTAVVCSDTCTLGAGSPIEARSMADEVSWSSSCVPLS
jgi:hypothetical protein